MVRRARISIFLIQFRPLAQRICRVGSPTSALFQRQLYTTIPNLVILPGVAIASRRAVQSILLVSKVTIEKIKTVALDTSSLTSVALTKVLSAKW